jgi:NADH:ubiquinone reductase (H+-translocating)
VSTNRKLRVLVLGGGFGGLTFCLHFRQPRARITLVDRTNHHLFQPLLYQVATAGLAATDIAQPIRAILSKRQDVTVLLEDVVDFKPGRNQVVLTNGELDYDYLVLALGGRTSYFGHPEWERFAPGLKTLEDAVRIRNQVLFAFEKAENTFEPEERERLMTLVVAGGGPTGVELAGAIAELSRTVLRRDFRRIDPSHARIILVESSPLVLSHLPPDLSASATRQLEDLGVKVRGSARVKHIREGEVELDGGEIIHAGNIFWTAGISASPLTGRLGVELDKSGRVMVNPDLSLKGHPHVFAIGDMALVLQENGKPVPGVSPAAMQMARYVARRSEGEILHRPHPGPFKYVDKGTMATIGRSAAVAQIGGLQFSGWFAWASWLVVHLIFLIGFRNKLFVLLQWTYSYFAYKRGARIITQPLLAASRPENAPPSS